MLDTTASTAQYGGDGERGIFPIPFPFLETGHIHAHIRDGAGETRSLAAGVDYAVNRVSGANGELVLLAETLPRGHVLTIRRQLPLTQEIFFHNQGPNSPRAMEAAADKLTMIAQQLQADLEQCARAPEAEEEVAGRVAAVEAALGAKAERSHSHAQGEVSGLAAALAAKADAAAVTRALADKASLTSLSAKADRTDVAAKANAIHNHAPGDIAGLSDALDGKADIDDPRLGSASPAAHAASHAAGGADALTPSALGALPAPPRDGKSYLASGGGWTEYVPPEIPSGGAADHALLENRDAADQHPQSAIQSLPADLDALRAGLSELALAAEALGDRIGGKADRAELPAAATAQRDGLFSAADKAKLDAFSPGALEERLGTVDRRLEAAEGGVAAGESRAERIAARVTEAETDLASLQSAVETAETAVSALGALARAEDAPEDGLQYVRKNNAWAALQIPPSGGTGGGSGGGIVGDIRLLPFRADALPAGWHFCNGDRYPLSSAPGQALAALPDSFRADWGITSADGAISLPRLFDPAGGSGFFLRSVDNGTRLPGSAQGDAIRNITGSFVFSSTGGLVMVSPAGTTPSTLSGAFASQPSGLKTYAMATANYGGLSGGDLFLDASLVVPTAEENRPINAGMTPAIYLGV